MKYEEVTYLLFHCETDRWMEYTFNSQIGMYNYKVYNNKGEVELKGLVGMTFLIEKKETEPGWEFLGVL